MISNANVPKTTPYKNEYNIFNYTNSKPETVYLHIQKCQTTNNLTEKNSHF